MSDEKLGTENLLDKFSALVNRSPLRAIVILILACVLIIARGFLYTFGSNLAPESHGAESATTSVTNITTSYGQGGAASPGTVTCSGGGAGGGGGVAEGTIQVTPGEKLQIHIGNAGIRGEDNGNGGDTYIADASGTPLIYAQGGKGGKAGTCK